MTLALALVAAILAVIELFRTKFTSVLPFAVLALAAIFLLKAVA